MRFLVSDFGVESVVSDQRTQACLAGCADSDHEASYQQHPGRVSHPHSVLVLAPVLFSPLPFHPFV
eukprot:3174665-Rhodomonas_salina.1